jgi:hypothetical protein
MEEKNWLFISSLICDIFVDLNTEIQGTRNATKNQWLVVSNTNEPIKYLVGILSVKAAG